MEILLKSIETKYAFNQPVSESELSEVQEQLRINFPLELKTLLTKTNGITDNYGFDVVWSVKKNLG